MSADPLDFLGQTESSVPKGDPLDFLGQDVSSTRSLASAPVKGLLKGAQKFSPLPSFGPIPTKMKERLLEQFLPTREGTAEDILEFTGENVPLALLGEGGLVKKGLQALTGAFTKKGAKELNLPEWAQDIAGGVGMSAPEGLAAAGSKALRPAAKQQAVFDFLKNKGLSEKEITPIIQNKKTLSFLSKAASKFERDDPMIRGIKDKLGGIFEGIREQGRNAGYLEGPALANFEREFHDKLQKVPRMYQGLIKKEVEDLLQNPIDFTELHDFNKAINAIVKDVEGGKAAVGIMKGPIEKAQAKMNPGLYKELKQTNEAYSKIANYTDKMTRKDWDSLIGMGEAGGAVLGILTMNPALFGKAAGVAGTRAGAKQFLSNPRLHNIHLKMWDAFRKHKMPRVLQLAETFMNELKKDSEENNTNQQNNLLP